MRVRVQDKPGRTMRGMFVLLCVALAGMAAPRAMGQDKSPAASSDAAVRQYRDAAALQNRAVYDLAADEWNAFLKKYPTDPLAAKAQYYLGVCYFQLKKYDEARTALAAVAQNPQFELLESALLNLGLTYFSLGQGGQAAAYDNAVATLDRLLARFPTGKSAAQALYYRAEALDAAGKKDAAIQSWSQLLEKFPADPQRAETLYALGVTLEEQGKAAEAGKYYDQFLKEFPQHSSAVEVGMRKGETLFAAGDYAAAEKSFAAAAAAPNFALADHATMRRAAALYEQKKFAEAAAVYAAVPQKFPKSASVNKALLNAGVCYYRAGQNADAQTWLDRAAKAGDDTALEAAHWLARVWLKEGKPAEALKVAQTALAKANASQNTLDLLWDQADATYEIPERRKECVALYVAIAERFPRDALAPQALYLAAYTALGQGDYTRALALTDAFFALPQARQHESAADVKFVAAECLLQLKKPVEAEAAYRELIENYPQHADLDKWRVRRATALDMQKKYGEVVRYLSVELPKFKSPDAVAQGLYLVGNAQVNQQNYEGANKTLSSLLEKRPETAQAHLLRAIARQQLKDYARAMEDVAAYLKSDAPRTRDAQSEALYIRGLCEVATARTADAIQTFRSILADNPQYPDLDKVLFELAWALQSDGHAQASADAFAQLAKEYPNSSLAAESLYRLGEYQYQDKKDFKAAAAAYAKAIEVAGKSDVAEQAAHKLGWANYQLGDYVASEKAFARQLADFPQGKLAGDGLFMQAEALFKQSKFAEAAAAYEKALADKALSKDFRSPALLHAGQSLSQMTRWKDAQVVLEQCAQEYPDSPYRLETLFELAWVKQHLDQTSEALKLYETVADQSQQVVGARAQYMIAEIYLAQHNAPEAIRHYFKVAYGYGYPQAPEAFRVWQSNATYMAGFCFATQHKLDQAKKLFTEVIDNYPDSEKAPLAKQKLAELEK